MEEKSKKPLVSEKKCLLRLLIAREHISVSTDEWKCVVLNHTEKLWTELNCLTKDRQSKNENELFEVVKNGLQAITEELLHQFVESMPCRYEAAIGSKGVSTKC